MTQNRPAYEPALEIIADEYDVDVEAATTSRRRPTERSREPPRNVKPSSSTRTGTIQDADLPYVLVGGWEISAFQTRITVDVRPPVSHTVVPWHDEAVLDGGGPEDDERTQRRRDAVVAPGRELDAVGAQERTPIRCAPGLGPAPVVPVVAEEALSTRYAG